VRVQVVDLSNFPFSLVTLQICAFQALRHARLVAKWPGSSDLLLPMLVSHPSIHLWLSWTRPVEALEGGAQQRPSQTHLFVQAWFHKTNNPMSCPGVRMTASLSASCSPPHHLSMGLIGQVEPLSPSWPNSFMSVGCRLAASPLWCSG
jgi:hypothetical protein